MNFVETLGNQKKVGSNKKDHLRKERVTRLKAFSDRGKKKGGQTRTGRAA